MKQSLLLFVLLFMVGWAQAQLAMRSNCDSCPKNKVTYSKTDIKVYPNPATDFIAFQNNDNHVRKVVIYNMVGRPIDQFEAQSGKNVHNVSALARGMYLIQLMDRNGKIVTTKRINKR
ncbi:MAG: T9SS type A sorting domain-containing protein [Bacteroidota bacterium]